MIEKHPKIPHSPRKIKYSPKKFKLKLLKYTNMQSTKFKKEPTCKGESR